MQTMKAFTEVIFNGEELRNINLFHQAKRYIQICETAEK